MIEGSVVKAYVQQANREYKPRPAVLVRKLPYFDDWLICGVSSKTYRVHHGFDILIDNQHTDFNNIGLPFPSVIRTGWLYTFPESNIEGILGKLSNSTLNQLKNNLKDYL